MRTGIGKNEVLCVDMDITCNSHQNNFNEVATIALTNRAGVDKPEFVHFWTFNVFSNKNKF